MTDALRAFLRPELDRVTRQAALRAAAEELLEQDKTNSAGTGEVYRIYSPSHSHIASVPVSLERARELFDRYEEHYGEDGVDIAMQRMVWVTIN
jgi:hypothetical protein